jgi:hypothetical protein
MSEGCIIIHRASRDEGMRRDTGMGITRDSVDDVDSFRSDRSSQISPVSLKSPGSPRQVTDGSEMSEYGGRKAIENIKKPQQDQPEKEDDIVLSSNRPSGSLTRAGPSMQEGQQSSSNCTSGPGSESYKSLPQHERIQEVEALDISYQSTEGSLKMKAFLLSRLTDAAPSGRLQVVSTRTGSRESSSIEPPFLIYSVYFIVFYRLIYRGEVLVRERLELLWIQ